MVSSPLELIETTHALVGALNTSPAGLCAIASVALWCLWKEHTSEELVLCIGFNNNVASHVFLRKGPWMLDPTSHQFNDHTEHCYEATHASLRVPHHQSTVETTCIKHFHDILRLVGWPSNQWPTKERVSALLQALRQHCVLGAHEKRRLSASCSNNDSA